MNMEAGTLAELNTPGELCIRGYCVMLGYWGEPQKTEEAVDQDKWYWTGDVATVNEQGFCKIMGRSKDMIIRGGENIYPAELEDFFHTHPKVQEVQISHFKIPRYVVFVTNYPLTISGKIQKFKLREQMERHLNL
nr:medium-chain acyl-CoA ligase ACSF2, mitochondrial-like [Symphalangus syndactylus]